MLGSCRPIYMCLQYSSASVKEHEGGLSADAVGGWMMAVIYDILSNEITELL